MSLGFNPNRPVRTTNLPGAVGGSILSVTRRRVRSPTGTATARPPTSAPWRVAPPTTTVVVTPSATTRRVHIQAEERVESGTSKVDAAKLYEEMQWVYANVTEPLVDADTDEAVGVDVDDRVLMVYPMQTDKDTGKVRMRLKSVHPVTGQLSVRWVVAYDPDLEMRFLNRFSLVA